MSSTCMYMIRCLHLCNNMREHMYVHVRMCTHTVYIVHAHVHACIMYPDNYRYAAFMHVYVATSIVPLK